MKITTKDVEQVALLSRLELPDGDTARVTEEMNAILDYMEVLNKADTTDIEATAHVLPLRNVMRPDMAAPSLPRRSKKTATSKCRKYWKGKVGHVASDHT